MPEHMPGPTSCRGVYGFALHLVARCGFIIFVLWSVVPEGWFHAVGITYLPQRYWAVAIPIFLLTILVLFAFIIYPCLGILMTPDADDMNVITDQHSKYESDESKQDLTNDKNLPCICRNQTFCMKHIYNTMDRDMQRHNAIPAVTDLHISKVCEELYVFE